MASKRDTFMLMCRSKVLITASGGARAKKVVQLKHIADKAVQLAASSGFQVGAWHSGACHIGLLMHVLCAQCHFLGQLLALHAGRFPLQPQAGPQLF